MSLVVRCTHQKISQQIQWKYKFLWEACQNIIIDVCYSEILYQEMNSVLKQFLVKLATEEDQWGSKRRVQIITRNSLAHWVIQSHIKNTPYWINQMQCNALGKWGDRLYSWSGGLSWEAVIQKRIYKSSRIITSTWAPGPKLQQNLKKCFWKSILMRMSATGHPAKPRVQAWCCTSGRRSQDQWELRDFRTGMEFFWSEAKGAQLTLRNERKASNALAM